MGHFCRICGRLRPNEQFSGKGHRQHVCKICAGRPINERLAAAHRQELQGFLSQSHISRKNLKRLATLKLNADAEVCHLATIVGEIAVVAPYRRKRIGRIRDHHPELFSKMVLTGLTETHEVFGHEDGETLLNLESQEGPLSYRDEFFDFDY